MIKQKWQPIETAPNNQEVLVYYDHGCIEKAIRNGDLWHQCCDQGLKLTYKGLERWQPLPETPEQEATRIRKEEEFWDLYLKDRKKKDEKLIIAMIVVVPLFILFKVISDYMGH